MSPVFCCVISVDMVDDVLMVAALGGGGDVTCIGNEMTKFIIRN